MQAVTASDTSAAPQQGGQSDITVLIFKHSSPTATALSNARRGELPFRKLHIKFGFVHMLIAAPCIILDSINLIPKSPFVRYGAGIYSGAAILVSGMLGFIAGKRNNTWCLIGCMIMNIIAICGCVVGGIFTGKEYQQRMYYETYRDEFRVVDLDFNYGKTSNPLRKEFLENYQSFQAKFGTKQPDEISTDFIHKKCILILIALIFEFFFSIVHLAFTCVSCCYCCMPKEFMMGTKQLPENRCRNCCWPGPLPQPTLTMTSSTVEGARLLSSLTPQQQAQLGLTSELVELPQFMSRDEGHVSSFDPSSEPPPSYSAAVAQLRQTNNADV